MNKQRNSKKRKTMLAVSAGLALTIVAGSTFAWFTSRDEVTNRLSASSNYGVSIAEDFQPPEDWVPGQVINKDVSAVNTGNVDAFVRMWLEGEMNVFKRTTLAASVVVPSDNPTALTEVTDEKYLNLGFNYVDGNSNYYKELSKLKRDNASNNVATAQNATPDNDPAEFSEVQAMQAGGYLHTVPENALYYYIVEQATTIEAYATADATTKTTINLKAGDYVATKDATVSAGTATVAYIDKGSKEINIDTSEFYPQTEGVYLFRRSVDLNSNPTSNSYKYSGYYYVPKSGNLISDTEADHYLALYTDGSGCTIPDTIGDSLKFYNAKEIVVENSGLTWAYDATAGSEKLTATYNGGTADAGTENDDISIDINLANIGTSPEGWTALGEPVYKTFYYNNDVEEGDTTAKLVDSVKLADTTSQDAYVAFDFDLNVFLESVQVTKNEQGVEGGDSVNPWTGSSANQAAYGAITNLGEEISSISWTTNQP